MEFGRRFFLYKTKGVDMWKDLGLEMDQKMEVFGEEEAARYLAV